MKETPPVPYGEGVWVCGEGRMCGDVFWEARAVRDEFCILLTEKSGSDTAVKETPLRQPADRSDILLPFYRIVFFSLFKTRLPAGPSTRGARGVFYTFRHLNTSLPQQEVSYCHKENRRYTYNEEALKNKICLRFCPGKNRVILF